MTEEKVLILSIIFCIISILSGALYRYKKYGIPLKATMLELWQEVIVGGFKECRASFIPTTKKAIGALREYSRQVYNAIAPYLRQKPIKHVFFPELYYCLQAAVSGYTYTPFQPEIYPIYSALPSYTMYPSTPRVPSQPTSKPRLSGR